MGVSKHTGGIQTWGNPNIQGYPNIWGYPNIQGGIWGHPNIQGTIQTYGSSKHMGSIQTYGASQYWGHSNVWHHPNVWGHMDTPLVWQSMLSLCCVCTGGIQTYGGQNVFIQSWTISAILNSTILDFCHLVFLILNILSIFQNIPLSFALCIDRNSLLWGVHVLIGTACCNVSDILSYILPAAAKSCFDLKSDNDLILNI